MGYWSVVKAIVSDNAIAFSDTTLGPFNYRLSHRPGDYSSDMGLI